MNRVFIISGPSGVGKGTLIQKLTEEFGDELFLSVSVTTRPPRASDIPGVTYDFIDLATYRRLLEQDALIEHAMYAEEGYGSRRSALDALQKGQSVIFEIEVNGMKQVKGRVPDAVSVFILPPSLDELRRRLKNRGSETDEKIEIRLERAKAEMAESGIYDYRIVNDDLEQAYRALREIFVKETARPDAKA